MSRPVPDPDALARLERRAERERRARHEAERLLEQKSLELYSANRLLEARVAERTAELEVALARAEQAGRARSAFLAMMSHEIRTPMNGVIGTADLLAQTGLSAEQLQYVNTIRECGQALTTLIDDILDFSRIDAGKLVLENQPLDLMALLASVCRLFAGAARDKGLTLEFVPGLAGPCGWIMGDAHRIRQIAVNLVGNAIKFTGRGRVSVRLLQAPAAEAGVCELRLAVSDTGIGLTPEAQTRFNEYKPKLQHHIILMLSDESPSELLTAKGKQELQERIASGLNKLLDEDTKTGITEVLFTDFIIQ